MDRRKAYLVSALVFLLLTALITVYPIVSYIVFHHGLPHDLSKANITYLGDIPPGSYMFVYHFEALGNGSYNFTGILYSVTSASWGLYSHGSQPSNWRVPFRNVTGLRELAEVNRVLPPTDPLIKFFFPKDSVYLMNETRKIVPIKKPEESDTGNWYFLPGYLGFPRLYAPEGLDAYNRSLAVKLDDKGYFPVVRYLKASNRYYLFSAHTDLRLDIGYFEFDRFFPRYVNIETLKSMYPKVKGDVDIQITNVQPLSQDWLRAIKYSYTEYNAPVTYIFTLAAVILLILAGRAGK
ncbi:hypothetical protein [Thermococcus sp.]